MASGYQSRCPLCDTPRADGQMRCVCNYTFEFERESRPFRKVSSSNRTMLIVVTAIVVLGAIGAGVVFLAP